jgi:hypothetical protein
MNWASVGFYFIAAYLLGFIVPGYLGSRLMRVPRPLATALPLSLLILFSGVLVVNAVGLPVRFGPVLVWQLGVTLLLGLGLWLFPPTPRTPKPPTITPPEQRWPTRVLMGCVALVLLLALVRGIMAPLTGGDIMMRWEYFAIRLLIHPSLDFYPPMSGRDFSLYFMADGMAPIVSIGYWWIYAALAARPIDLAMLFVFGQYVTVLLLVYATTAHLASRRAAWLAVATLTATHLLFRSVMIGQETGLTGIGVIGMIYCLSVAEDRRDWRPIALAGLMGAVSGLAREYGSAFLGVGVIVLLWRRMGLLGVLVFLTAAFIGEGPWYVRSWVRTGNPLYILEVGPFKSPNMFNQFLGNFHEDLTITKWPLQQWLFLAHQVLIESGLVFVAGIAGAIVYARRLGQLGLALLLCLALWVYSIGWTAGLVEYAMRVLPPALVILAVLSGVLLERLTQRRAMSWAIVAVITAATAWAVYCGLVFPITPRDVPKYGFGNVAFQRIHMQYPEWGMRDAIGPVLPRGSRVLGENARLQVELEPLGVELVPVWSPEVWFLFDPSVTADQQRRMLLQRNITVVAYYPPEDAPNTAYCIRHSAFYAQEIARLPVLMDFPGLLKFLRITPP